MSLNVKCELVMGVGGFWEEWLSGVCVDGLRDNNQLRSSHARWAMKILGNIDDAISFIALLLKEAGKSVPILSTSLIV